LVSESVSPSLSVSKQLSLSDAILLSKEELLAGRGQHMSTRSIEGDEEEDEDDNDEGDNNEDNNRDDNQSRLERQEILGKTYCPRNNKQEERIGE
jgi:hypothetical protein